MSLNQSSFEKSESQYRKSGRSRSSGLPIGSSGGRGDGGWESAPPTTTSLSTSRRGSNATGNVEAIAVNATAVGTVEKRGQVESPLHGASSAAVPVRKAPSSQAPAITSDRKPPTIAAKDASKAFPLRFGSISPGFMNGMQIPAPTSSAPSNWDERKLYQMPPLLSNIVMGITPQFSQQQASKDAGYRKTDAVKIINPKTHEELRLDKRADNVYTDGGPSGPRAHPIGKKDYFSSGRDVHLDIGYGGSLGNRPNQGGNFGVLRNPLNQSPVPSAGGILSGPMMQRTNSNVDKWQRATGYPNGLNPSPRTPFQLMHKAERKYVVKKVTDGEQAKQRQLKALVNKLTPWNFKELLQQVKVVNIDNVVTLACLVLLIFNRALMEPTFCEMYANFCCHLANELPDLSEDNEKITFKRLLLNKCQEEFERGEREQEEANRVEEEGQVKQSNEEREEKRIQARRRMLGNIRLIGELYKKKMLTERIMHECIKKLLGQCQTPDEEDVEALCKLMSTIGEIIDHPKAKEHMDVYFSRMANLSENKSLSSRVRFILKDVIDLRKNKWQQRRKVEQESVF